MTFQKCMINIMESYHDRVCHQDLELNSACQSVKFNNVNKSNSLSVFIVRLTILVG